MSEEKRTLDKETLIQEVKGLNLPEGQYAVFGSGPMTAYNLRNSSDVDLIVTSELYEKLRDSGEWEESHYGGGDRYLTNGIFEAMDTWNEGNYRGDIQKLIETAKDLEGVPFVSLTEVYKWKKAFGREQDQKDLKLIEQIYQVPRERFE